MKLETHPRRPDLHVTVMTPKRVDIAQMTTGGERRIHLTMPEARAVADALHDAVEGVEARQIERERQQVEQAIRRAIAIVDGATIADTLRAITDDKEAETE